MARWSPLKATPRGTEVAHLPLPVLAQLVDNCRHESLGRNGAQARPNSKAELVTLANALPEAVRRKEMERMCGTPRALGGGVVSPRYRPAANARPKTAANARASPRATPTGPKPAVTARGRTASAGKTQEFVRGANVNLGLAPVRSASARCATAPSQDLAATTSRPHPFRTAVMANSSFIPQNSTTPTAREQAPTPKPKEEDESPQSKAARQLQRESLEVLLSNTALPTREELASRALVVAAAGGLTLQHLKEFTDQNNCWGMQLSDVARKFKALNGAGTKAPIQRHRVRLVAVIATENSTWGDIMSALHDVAHPQGGGAKAMRAFASRARRFDQDSRTYSDETEDEFDRTTASQRETRFIIPAIACACFENSDGALICAHLCRIVDAVLLTIGRETATSGRNAMEEAADDESVAWPLGYRYKNPFLHLPTLLAIAEADDAEVPIAAVARQLVLLEDGKAPPPCADPAEWPASEEVPRINLRWIIAAALIVDGDAPDFADSRSRRRLRAYIAEETRYFDPWSLASRARGTSVRCIISSLFLYPELAAIACGCAFGPRASVDHVLRGKDVTLLHAAAFANHAALLKGLLRRGANPNATDRFGRTAVSYASEAGSGDIVKALVDAGANAVLRDCKAKYDKNTVYDSLHEDRDGDRNTGLSDHNPLIKLDVPTPLPSRPSSQMSVRTQDPHRPASRMSAIVEAPSRPTSQSSARSSIQSRTPSRMSRSSASSNPARSDSGLKVADKAPFHYACAHNGRAGALRALIRSPQGVDVFAQDMFGFTGLHYAIMLRRTDAVNTLLCGTFDPKLGAKMVPWGKRGGEPGYEERVKNGVRDPAALARIDEYSSPLEVAGEMLLVPSVDGSTPASLAAAFDDRDILKLVDRTVDKLRRRHPVLARRIIQERYHCTRLLGTTWLETHTDGSAGTYWSDKAGPCGWVGLVGEVSAASLQCIEEAKDVRPEVVRSYIR